ncbi:MAG TPA: hypothetical protein VHG71_11390, partial [Verrucomicrobiae bacterium]|nr:hypothetical protein [Verrucomicrobiae bacterium]
PHVDEGISCSQIYSNVVGKQAFKLRKHEYRLLTTRIKSLVIAKVKQRFYHKSFGSCPDLVSPAQS